jgi:hypothetical protein
MQNNNNKENNRSSKSDKPSGPIKTWLVRFIIIALLWLLLAAAHVFVQYPENRATTFCSHTYYITKFYYVDLLRLLTFNDSGSTLARSREALHYKLSCDETQAFGIPSLIPNIYSINIKDTSDEQ